jgi:hypothetical protein
MVRPVLSSSCVSAIYLYSASPGRQQAPNKNGVHRPQDTTSTGKVASYQGEG